MTTLPRSCATGLALLALFTISLSGPARAAGPYPSLGGPPNSDMVVDEMVVASPLMSHRPGVRHSRHRRSPTPGDRATCNGEEPVPANRVSTGTQLERLREKMAGKVKAYIIRMDDAHQSEYVSAYDMRVKFISGFSGSAGTAVVLDAGGDRAALWVDGRYFLQGEQQIDCSWTLMRMGVTGVPTLTAWLKEVLQPGDNVGADPKLISYDRWIIYKEALEKADLVLEAQDDLVGAVWDEMGGRPHPPNEPLQVLDIEFTGESWQDKVKRLRERFSEKTKAAVITALDDVAWLFNLRGSDVPYNPVFYAYAIVGKNHAILYLPYRDTRLRKTEVQEHLNTSPDGSCSDPTSCVQVKQYEAFFPDLGILATEADTKIWVSPMSSYAIFSRLGSTEEAAKEKAYLKTSGVRTMKGQKNPVEVEGLRRCHIRDSVAVVEFIARLEKDITEGLREWDELSASDELESIRRKLDYNMGLSFATISGSGPNGAVIHYKASNLTKRPITTSDMYLLDSGGQYLDGTTDVTRTFHFGEPTAFQKEAYTRVLMGVIDLATAVWPLGIFGRDIDVLARRPLWSVGLNYRHGTGHGIGAYLNVHEGPGRISHGYYATSHEEPLLANMFFSDEPGFYKDGEFGVRLETIVMTKVLDLPHRFDSDYLGFEAFTLVPFEPKLIDMRLLNADQRRWLNSYHTKVQEEIAEKILKPAGKTQAYDWVTSRTHSVPDLAAFVASEAASGRHVISWSALLVALLVACF